MQALLRRGANFSRANDDGDTPAHLAAWHNNAPVIRMLYAAGAQVHATSSCARWRVILAQEMCERARLDLPDAAGVPRH